MSAGHRCWATLLLCAAVVPLSHAFSISAPVCGVQDVSVARRPSSMAALAPASLKQEKNSVRRIRQAGVLRLAATSRRDVLASASAAIALLLMAGPAGATDYRKVSLYAYQVAKAAKRVKKRSIRLRKWLCFRRAV